MPFFYKRKSKKKSGMGGIIPSTTTTSANASSVLPITSKPSSSSNHHRSATKSSKSNKQPEQRKLEFQCQLAHGSPTGLISGFSNVKDLYQKIADCFEISASTVSFVDFSINKNRQYLFYFEDFVLYIEYT